jgi:hypothetical protein
MPAAFARAQATRVKSPAQLGMVLKPLVGGVQLRNGSLASDASIFDRCSAGAAPCN